MNFFRKLISFAGELLFINEALRRRQIDQEEKEKELKERERICEVKEKLLIEKEKESKEVEKKLKDNQKIYEGHIREQMRKVLKELEKRQKYREMAQKRREHVRMIRSAKKQIKRKQLRFELTSSSTSSISHLEDVFKPLVSHKRSGKTLKQIHEEYKEMRAKFVMFRKSHKNFIITERDDLLEESFNGTMVTHTLEIAPSEIPVRDALESSKHYIR